MAGPNRVKEVRESLGQNRDWLASKAGVTLRTVRDVESGLRSPSVDTARKFAMALGVKDISVIFPPDDVPDSTVQAGVEALAAGVERKRPGSRVVVETKAASR